jgi:hypothetical protein
VNAEVAQSLAGIQDATGRPLATVGGLTDAPLREPSLLPGRSRGHVLTHITRNAADLAAELRDSAAGVRGAGHRPARRFLDGAGQSGRPRRAAGVRRRRPRSGPATVALAAGDHEVRPGAVRCRARPRKNEYRRAAADKPS